jgi:hypothetical protein
MMLSEAKSAFGGENGRWKNLKITRLKDSRLRKILKTIFDF